MSYTPDRTAPVIVQVRDAIENAFELVSSSGQTSSGTTAVSTTGATWGTVTAITVAAATTYNNIRIYNVSGAAGFFSFDSGTTYHYLPANSSIVMLGVFIAASATIKVTRATNGGAQTPEVSVFVSIW